MLVEHPERERLERRVHGGDLRQDLDAVAVVLDHPLDTAHLALDAVQALDQRVLVLRVAVDGTLGDVAHGFVLSLTRSKRRRRRLFVTTKRLDAAIAAGAIIGLRSPATASGIAATLRANAQNRFPLIVRSVLRASRIASAAARRSPDTSVRSDASIATRRSSPRRSTLGKSAIALHQQDAESSVLSSLPRRGVEQSGSSPGS